MYQGADVQQIVLPVFGEHIEWRMKAHFYRLFLDACAMGAEPPLSMRQHGRKINQELFGIVSKGSTQHKNSVKRQQTCGRPCYMAAQLSGERLPKEKILCFVPKRILLIREQEGEQKGHRKWGNHKFRNPYLPAITDLAATL